MERTEIDLIKDISKNLKDGDIMTISSVPISLYSHTSEEGEPVNKICYKTEITIKKEYHHDKRII